MRKATAEKVADLLGLVEEYLAAGRPRKLPGKPRPEATTIWGDYKKRVNPDDFFIIDKVSLVGAFKMALREQEYSRTVREYAALSLIFEGGGYKHFIESYKPRGSSVLYDTLQWMDDNEPDTRHVIREVRKTRRFVERRYLFDRSTA